MAYELKGKIEVLGETQQITEKFKKREFVVLVEDNPTYPEKIKMEFIQDKCSSLDSYDLQDAVTVNINLKGRDWVNKEREMQHFTTIQAWKIEKEVTAEPHGHAPIEEYIPF